MLSFLFLHGCSKIQFSEYNIVLPFKLKDHKSPTFNLTAYRGNVKFVSLNEKLLTVQPNPSRRDQSSAMLVVHHEGPNPERVNISVTSPSDEPIIFPVYIEGIHSAVIETRRKYLYTNITIDEYSIKPKNEFGDIIETLDGYDVEWIFNSSVIRRLSQGEIDRDTIGSKLESHIFVQGILPGKFSLGAKIANTVIVPNVTITIIDPIYLLPSSKTMLPGCNFQAKLCKKNYNTYNNSCDQIDLPKEKYFFSSQDENIVTVDQSARIHAVHIGTTQVRVTNKEFALNRVDMNIEVVSPSKIFIPEQWIIIGEAPSTDGAIFYDHNNNILDKPAHIDWQLTDEYKNLGNHTVTATAFGKSTQFRVHVYERPRFDPDDVVLPLHHNEYYPNLIYGSGDFTWSTPNIKGIIIGMFHNIISYEVGKYQVIAHDNILNVDAILHVTIEKMVDPRFVFPRTEFIPNENVSYTFQVRSQGGRPFTHLDPFTVTSAQPNIVHDSDDILTSISKGFATITCKITDYEQITLIGVYEPLSVTKIITVDNVEEETPNLDRQDGPMQWPDSKKPKATITCGNAKVELIDDTYLRLRSSYNGMCKLSVVNEKTAANPSPRPDSVEFQVRAIKIDSIAIVVIDPKSKNIPESGLAKSTVNTTEILDLQGKDVKIPAIHQPELKIFAFSEGKNLIGEYSHPKQIIQVGDRVFNKTSQIPLLDDETLITVIMPESLQVRPVSVKVIPIQKITLQENISIYDKSETGVSIPISGGTGNYTIVSGSGATIDGNSLTLMPSKANLERKVTVKDYFIDEYKETIVVRTEAPARLVIEGPDVCVVGTIVRFKPHVLSAFNNEIPTTFEDYTASTPGLTHDHDNEWAITATSEGRIDIVMSALGLSGSRILIVLNKIMIDPENVTMFPGETLIPHIIGAGKNDIVIFSTTDKDVANMDGNILRAVSAGKCVITARIEGKPILGEANLTIHVLHIKDFKILQFPEHPYVDSIIHLTPIFETDIGPIIPRTTTWIIEGNNQWEKLYDNSVIIRANSNQSIYVNVTSLLESVAQYIEVDDKLELETPREISIPVNHPYTIKVKNNLPANHSVLCSEKGLNVQNGTITGTKPGRYVVKTDYKQQWQVTQVTVSTPEELYLQTDAASILPIPLDINGQQYTEFSHDNLKYNVSKEAILNNERYSFGEVEEPTYVQFTFADGKNYAVKNTTLISHSMVYPEAPFVMKGASLQFSCAAKRPRWSSSNDYVVTINDYGLAKAVKGGRSTISCDNKHTTPITVVELRQIQINERIPMKEYAIEPSYTGAIGSAAGQQVYLPNDIQLSCSWNAPSCGEVKVVSPNNLSNAYCQVILYSKRTCPQYIDLNATITSRITGLEVTGHKKIIYESDVWGVPSYMQIMLTKEHPSKFIPVKPSKDEIIVYKDAHYEVEFPENGGFIIKATKRFNGQGKVILEYNGTKTEAVGERVEIDINPTNVAVVQPNLWDRLLFILSVICTVVLGLYAAYMLGQSGNLPAFSPYKTRN
ncbi:hypothetical protein TVAG_150040 [Trichomonas vaginalis G3]|uniref:BIG2 domain-containing protein n=1 Tax=Trichomonas vaginalis (strain ATCC PRA-98 / G3) TaxID=412133 RepID=A2DRQ6_TRIV3|nr:nuclear pore membrane glycoprotein GP210-related family [Trichomonas vaginalis G3]EAY16853.1 hypothetical protein TVAG_150040 [Trichomonas vaginalis G3]KAI5489158.1 nuclear pore membrane glycoprotein GP210-related family [Trichomonas vaginalis G3]|eukprot:XP_001329076.1 hypothetical protein [Trichomonas vaginalis G3]